MTIVKTIQADVAVAGGGNLIAEGFVQIDLYKNFAVIFDGGEIQSRT